MNVKITTEQHTRLCTSSYVEYEFGSRLFNTHNESSDYDYMRVYKYESVFESSDHMMPNIHSFQYDDGDNQYIWITERQFHLSLYSGDGTIQSDIVLFHPNWGDLRLELTRTYKIIKSYCGVAKRDLRYNDDKKRFHAQRSLYIASELIDNRLPNLEYIKNIQNNLLSKTELLIISEELRVKSARMYERKELENYYIPNTTDDLLNLMLSTNNIREFKY